MVKFAANLSMMFNEHDFLDRFEAAAGAGFTGVEYLFPYDFEAGDLADRLQSNGLAQALYNFPPGDWAAGERGIASLPDRKDHFRADIDRALAYAAPLNCKRLHCMAGVAPEGADRDAMRATYVENLAFAAGAVGAEGIELLIEPINNRDIPGYFLNHSAEAMAIIDEVGADNLRLQYDIYHMQIMEGDLAPTIERLLGRIGHIQIADTPGRHEPGTGEINYPFLFGHLDRIGYEGWVGCEYVPANGTVEGLGWYAPYRQ